MTFKYDMLQTGWGRAEITSGTTAAVFEPSYVSDPYGDMIRAVCSIVPELTPAQEHHTQARVSWHMEPVETVIDLLYTAPDIRISITQFDSSESQIKKSIILNDCLSADEFIGELVDAGRRMLVKYGLIGYRRNAVNFEFPLSAFLKLCDYTRGGRTLMAVKNPSAGLFSSCIEGELARLADIHEKMNPAAPGRFA
ncbi:MAG: hypothetical protein JXB03_01430 [Spirochaetales bacterium]|nr:hypothetical protein [Spirochaetales bacterium]